MKCVVLQYLNTPIARYDMVPEVNEDGKLQVTSNSPRMSPL